MRHSLPVRRLWLSASLWTCATLGFAQQTKPATSSAQPSQAATSDFAHARTLMQEGKLDDAVAELQTLEAANPTMKGLDLELGAAYYKKSDYPKAIAYLKKATAADPSNGEATQMLGLSYYLGGHPADAIPLLEKVQTWYPRANVDASYILGICYILCENVRRPARLGRQLPVHRAHAAPPGVRSHCGRICAEGRDARSQASAVALFAGRVVSVQIENSGRNYRVPERARHQSWTCCRLLQVG